MRTTTATQDVLARESLHLPVDTAPDVSEEAADLLVPLDQADAEDIEPVADDAGEEDEERERMLADCIAAIRRRRERRARGRLLAELRAAEARGDAPAAEAAQRQLHEYLTEKPRT